MDSLLEIRSLLHTFQDGYTRRDITRLDAFMEPRLRLWDIAAGGLMVECAGGEFCPRPIAGAEAYEVMATNSRLRRALERRLRP